MDDHALLSDFVNSGKAEALGELVQRYEPMIRASAMRQLGDAHMAQDIAQSAMMALMRKAPQIRHDTPIGPWLVRTTHYLAIDAMRSASAHRRHERLAAQERREMFDTPSQVTIEPVLDRAINLLPDKYRVVLVLRYLQGWSYRQIADELDLSNIAVRQRLSRALAMLRRALDRDGVEVDDLMAAVLPLGGLIEHLQSAPKWRTNPFWKYLAFKPALTAAAAAIIAGGIAATAVAMHHAPAKVSVMTPPPEWRNLRPASTVP
jgi:RNA polymerase sigma-70 factor, ECF subfamily